VLVTRRNGQRSGRLKRQPQHEHDGEETTQDRGRSMGMRDFDWGHRCRVLTVINACARAACRYQ
jgi:hypothetical protein